MQICIKYFICFLIVLTIQNQVHAQFFHAKYNVEMTYPVDNGNGTISVPYKGLYFASGSRSISWMNPNFPEVNANGVFYFKKSASSFSTQPMQQMVYVDRDSMILRYNADGSNNYVQKFEPELYIWQFEKETKTIRGLTCKKLLYKKSNTGPALGEIWYFPDITMPVGLMMMIGLPGLMVEWEIYGFLKASIEDYSFQENQDESIFWPKVFNKPFKDLPPFKSAHSKND